MADKKKDKCIAFHLKPEADTEKIEPVVLPQKLVIHGGWRNRAFQPYLTFAILAHFIKSCTSWVIFTHTS